MSSPTETIREAMHTIELVTGIVGHEPKGPDGKGWYLTLCPFHDDTHPSFRVNVDGGYTCLACGAKGGDVIDFYAAVHGLDLPTAIRQMVQQVGGAPEPNGRRKAPRIVTPQQRPSEAPQAPQGRPIPNSLIPKPGKAVELSRPGNRPFRVRPSHVYPYRNADGVAHHLILREESGPVKRFYPALWDGERFWSVAQPTPRTLYGLETLHAELRQVIVVEGEKAADAARDRLPKQFAVVTWPGGANAIGSIDWQPLFGRPVLLWPDNDAAGRQAMHAIARVLDGGACQLRIIEPKGLPPKGDAADVSPDLSMLEWLRDRSGPWVAPDAAIEESIEREAEKEAETDAPPLADDNEGFLSTQAIMEARANVLPFHVLGQRGTDAYFLTTSDGRIVRHRLVDLQKSSHLLTIATPKQWQDAFTKVEDVTNKDGTINWRVLGVAAQNFVIEACRGMNEFDPAKTQGRGCWPHDGEIAFNRGDQVQIGSRIQSDNFVDGVVFTRGAPLRIEKDSPLTNAEGRELQAILSLGPWTDPASAVCLAGWIALGPICGALTWRPHVWLTGPSGSGKSTILDTIVWPAIGKQMAIRVAGSTTEPGLRQAIGHDALPVLIDEAEPDAKSMKQILDLARSSSSGDIIVRGSADQSGAMIYQIRSTFCFSAINPAIAKFADETRIARLNTRKRVGKGGEDAYRELTERRIDLIDDRFGPRLAARMIANVGKVLKNITIMEDAIARRFDSRRLAQQYGALLGGAWSLVDDEIIDEARASEMAENVPDQSVQITFEEDDVASMVHHFLAWQLEVDGKSRIHLSLGEAIERIRNWWNDEDEASVDKRELERSLARVGFRVDDHGTTINVARNHPVIKGKILKDTPWVSSYSQTFQNLEGSVNSGQMRYAGDRYMAVTVPIGHFHEDETR